MLLEVASSRSKQSLTRHEGPHERHKRVGNRMWDVACFDSRISFSMATRNEMATQTPGAKRPMSYDLHGAPDRLTEAVSANAPAPHAPTSADAAKRRQDPATVNRLLSSTID